MKSGLRIGLQKQEQGPATKVTGTLKRQTPSRTHVPSTSPNQSSTQTAAHACDLLAASHLSRRAVRELVSMLFDLEILTLGD